MSTLREDTGAAGWGETVGTEGPRTQGQGARQAGVTTMSGRPHRRPRREGLKVKLVYFQDFTRFSSSQNEQEEHSPVINRLLNHAGLSARESHLDYLQTQTHTRV